MLLQRTIWQVASKKMLVTLSELPKCLFHVTFILALIADMVWESVW